MNFTNILNKFLVFFFMNLEQLADGTKTDKNYYHSYLPLYQTLMEHKQLTAKHVLEIGIERGGSIKLWHDFFPHATIEAIDVRPMSDMWEGILNNDRIVLHTSTDAYDFSFFHSLYNQGIKYDVLIDDGPHTLTSMITFLQLYSHLMTDDGILIIEDVQSIDWIPALADSVPEKFKPFVKCYDLRPNKNRYDDIVFTIDKRNGSYQN